MRWFVTDDNVCITQDDFVNTAVSPAVCVPRDSETGKIVEERRVLALPFGDFCEIRDELVRQAIERQHNNQLAIDGDYVAEVILALKTASAANIIGGWNRNSKFQEKIDKLIERFEKKCNQEAN